MLPKTIDNYGGPWIDAEALANPLTDQPASSMNRIGEDAAQMTRTSTKTMVSFATSVAAPSAVAVVDASSQWGDGNAYKPTVEKTATGTYEILYATSYDDALVGTPGNEEVEQTEAVVFRFIWGNAIGSVFGHVQGSSIDNVVTAHVFDATGALSDLGGGVVVQLFTR